MTATKISPRVVAERIVESAITECRMIIVAGTGAHCREVFEEVLALAHPDRWSRRDLTATYSGDPVPGAIRCSLSTDSCRGVSADTVVIIDPLSTEREQSLQRCLFGSSSPRVWRPDVAFAGADQVNQLGDHPEQTSCRHCGHPIARITTPWGPKWFHLPAPPQPSEPERYCRLRTAEPEEDSVARHG